MALDEWLEDPDAGRSLESTIGSDQAAIAGLSISGPVARITDDRIDEIGAQVRHEAAALTAALGGAAQG